MKFIDRYLSVYLESHCRRGGGLFFGIKLHFPLRICPNPSYENYYDMIGIYFGFILFTIKIDIKYNHYEC